MRKFDLGKVYVTSSVHERIEESKGFQKFVRESLLSYIGGDWGDTGDEDKDSNDRAIENGEDRILAVYIYPETGERILIVTEWDRSSTTILFPSEY